MATELIELSIILQVYHAEMQQPIKLEILVIRAVVDINSLVVIGIVSIG